MWAELLKPGATGAPILIEWGAMGLGLFLATFLGALMRNKGREDARSDGQVAQIAGAVIDKRDAEAIIASIEANSGEIGGNTRALSSLSRRLDQNAEAVKGLSGEVGELRSEMRELTRELIRSKQ